MGCSQLIGCMNVRVQVHDAKTGRLLEDHETRNLVVDTGLNATADLWGFPDQIYSAAYTPNYIAIDSSANATTAVMTAPVSEIALSRKQITRKRPGNKSIIYEQFYGTTECNGTNFRAACLMSTSAAGIMFARAAHTTIAKTDLITVLYTWTITFGAN
jgi:hypothetical protein